MRNQWNKWIIAIVMGLVLIGQVNVVSAGNILVFAASSLTDALEDIASQYKEDKDIEVVISYAGTSSLARQIVQGAPVDLFISADQQWMSYLADKKKIVLESRYKLLGNSLVLIVPKDSKISEIIVDRDTDWFKLLGAGRLAMGDPNHVPAGTYAKESLQSFGSWSILESKIAPTNSVRSAMKLVERGETLLGIVYGSDALISNNVKAIGTFPQNSHKPIEYSMAIVKGHDNAYVKTFYNYLKGPEAAAIFERYGFTLH